MLEGVKEEQAKKRTSDKTNTILFTVCHMLDARYFLASLMGVEAECPYKKHFDSARTIDDDTVRGGIAFLIQHESYHLGQLGLIRKYLGMGPMKYSS